jgi:multiple antibiotic resistance protein
VDQGSVLAVILFVLVLVMLMFLLASPVERLLGESGRNVLTRLLGVLLSALSVQFIADGIQAIIAG